MSNISFPRYVDITSAVGGAAAAEQRELMLRLITTNALIPTGTVVEFDDIGSVLARFDSSTDVDFLQAQQYFGFISKLATTPNKISYTFWNDVATEPKVFGGKGLSSADLATFQGISAGSIKITAGVLVGEVTGIDFVTAGVSDFDAVAALILAQLIIAESGFTGSTLTYNAIQARFEFVGPSTGAATMLVEVASSGVDIAITMNWLSPEVILSNGADIQTITEVLTQSTSISNNFGSFSFVPDLTATDDGQIEEAATWNHGENVKYMYLQKVTAAQAAANQVPQFTAALSGTALTLYDPTLTTQFPWLFPGSIMAATPYNKRASVQNYMYQQSGLSALVSDDTTATTFDDLRVNYSGQTQTAGNQLVFYQRGFLQGLPNAPTDMGPFANEVFLKDAISVSIINLLLALSSVPANATGKAQVLAAIQADIDNAVFNGIISVGKTLTALQIATITSITGDATSFLQIQGIGYWITAVIEEPTTGNFEVVYTLLYAQGSSVRKVVGSHILI